MKKTRKKMKMNKKFFMASAAAFAMGLGSAYAGVAVPDGNPATDLDITAPSTNITGNTLTSGTAEVNDTVTVKPAATGPSVPVVSTLATPVPIKVEYAGGGTLQYSYFKVGEVSITGATTTDGGVTLETNGNGTFASSTSTTTLTEYDQIQKVTLVWDAVSSSYVQDLVTYPDVFEGGEVNLAGDDYTSLGALVPNNSTGLLLVPPPPTSTTTTNAGGDVDVQGKLSLGDTGTGAIADAAAAINGNTSDITTNTSDIADNASDIADNASDIADNDSDIADNASDIADNDSDIAVNVSDIADNASDITDNDSDIAVNVSDIADNASDIAQEVADRSELISDEGPNADGNQVVHIGDNSLITEELDGTQRLRAEDGSNAEIPIRFDGSQGVYVDNFINVTAPDTGAQFSTNNSSAGQVNPETDTSGPTSTPVVTVLGTVTGTEVVGASGGVLIESNGDVTLSQSGGTQSSVELVKVAKLEVYNADQGALAGTQVPGSQEWAVGYLNGNGEFVELQGGLASAAAAQTFIETTPISNSIYNGIRTTQTLSGTGGNLQVGGDANVDGALTANEISISNNATIGNDLTVQDDLTVADNASVGTDLSVGRSIYVADDVYVGGRATGLQSQVDTNRVGIETNADDIETNTRGIAMVAAMTNLRVEEGNKHALDVNMSYFEDEAGLGVGYAYRVNDTVQLNFAGASTLEFSSYVVRAGIGFQW